MKKKHNIIILEKDLPNLEVLAKSKKFRLKGKQIFLMEIKYIQPNRFHEKIYEKNWLFALDVLQNGDSFDEIYILILKDKEELKTLNRIQQMVVKGYCEDFSNILD